MAELPDRDRLDVSAYAACLGVKDELEDAARIRREGGDLASHYPDLARHLEECEWCRMELAELIREPDVSAEPDIEPESIDRVEGDLVAALRTHERIVRVRAAARLGAARRIGAGAIAALSDVASKDPDAEVRKAALDALAQLFGVTPRDRQPS
jgi:hypothetical protein